MATETEPAFERLLDYVRDNRGFDFTGYKRPSLVRRVRKRMQEVGIEGFADYQDHLEVHPDEFTHLFNTILINVTGFFRDEQAWDYLGSEVLPRIIERRLDGEHIRVWSVGCASGEEAYSAAMLLAEAIGVERMLERVKIYATDVDDDALTQARLAVYGDKAVEAIPDELRERYLEPSNGDHAFRKEIRRAVIFGRHDLVRDAPISRVDLIVCRNTLMYFNAETQTRIYNSFHFALRPQSYLFLGKSEMLLTRTSIFEPVDLKRRIFVRVSQEGENERREEARMVVAAPRGDALRDATFERSSVAQLLVDRDGALVAANSTARSQLGVRDADFGRPFHELEISYRPLELRSRIERAKSERQPNVEPAVTWPTGPGESRRFDVEVIPLLQDRETLGTMITFTDVSRAYELQAELDLSRRELETAYEEIQSTVEELETTNEELQSTNEELETTNEELQSTNEELETMNEELQSTNEELETLNTELRDRTLQLNDSNAFLESVLGSVRAGVVVIDPQLNVQSWNALAEDLWGLRTDEVAGKNILALDFGLPTDQLTQPIREVAAGASDYQELTLDATNRRGKPFRCKVVVSRLDGDGIARGVILLMEPEGQQA